MFSQSLCEVNTLTTSLFCFVTPCILAKYSARQKCFFLNHDLFLLCEEIKFRKICLACRNGFKTEQNRAEQQSGGRRRSTKPMFTFTVHAKLYSLASLRRYMMKTRVIEKRQQTKKSSTVFVCSQ